jgi:hypothetical protein
MGGRADDGIRTRDTWLGKPVLYQLSYVRLDKPILARCKKPPAAASQMAHDQPSGREPAERALGTGLPHPSAPTGAARPVGCDLSPQPPSLRRDTPG